MDPYNNRVVEATPSSVNELDGVDDVVKWLMEGRADIIGFAKYLPNTAQDLRDGKVTPEKLSHDLIDTYMAKKGEYEGIGGLGIDCLDIDIIAGAAALSALPSKFFRNAQKEQEESVEIVSAFARDVQSSFVKASAAAKDQYGRVETLYV